MINHVAEADDLHTTEEIDSFKQVLDKHSPADRASLG